MTTVPSAQHLTLDGVSGGVVVGRGSARFETPDLARSWVLSRFGLAVLAMLLVLGGVGFLLAEDTQRAVTALLVIVIGVFVVGGLVGWGFRLRNASPQPVPLLRAATEPSGGVMAVTDADGLDRTLVTDQASAEYLHRQLGDLGSISQSVTVGQPLVAARTRPFIMFAMVDGLILSAWTLVMFVL